MSDQNQINILRFGIPTLDQLLGEVKESGTTANTNVSVPVAPSIQPNNNDPAPQDSATNVQPRSIVVHGIGVSCSNDPGRGRRQDVAAISICMIGEDGVGKSILAMHIASKYRADSESSARPYIVYASTDLSHSRAQLSWEHFALNYPTTRVEDPFDYSALFGRKSDSVSLPTCELTNYVPLDDPFPSTPGKDVLFLDLATHTSGDDWAYLNRLVATLPHPDSHQPRHMLVVDAVEGLEVLVGEKDAFGQSRDRRSRVAQLLRTAAVKCHVILLVEKQEKGKKTPEEFIADAVISLGRHEDGGYARRTVQVEKVRGQSHVRGIHEITFRSGAGSTTGKRFNADDPFVVHPASLLKTRQVPAESAGFDSVDSVNARKIDPQAYAYVFHSLHFLHRQVMEDRESIEFDDAPKRVCGFGIDHLDEMLLDVTDVAAKDDDTHGLPSREPAALIGEDGTYKSKLSKAFLAQANNPERSKKGIAVLVTSKTLDEDGLRRRLNGHMQDPSSKRICGQHVLCRRLEVHHVSSTILFHIIRQTIRRAQVAFVLNNKDSLNTLLNEKDRRELGWNIRFVIDNWSAIGSMYPHVREDPLFWPCVLFFLRREGISTLIVASEPIGFSRDFQLAQTGRLQDLTSVQLFTWRVPFFGESRVAITVTPPLQADGRGSVIRELRLLKQHKVSNASSVGPLGESELSVPGFRSVPKFNSLRVAVNPTFELYDGLAKGEPKYVPLQVWLYEGIHTRGYIDDIQQIFRWLLSDFPNPLPQTDSRDVNRTGAEASGIIDVKRHERYGHLREFCELQGIARFPYTLVIQVDEYWAKTNHLQFAPLTKYLTRPTTGIRYDKVAADSDGSVSIVKQFTVEDPFTLWQLSTADVDRFQRQFDKSSSIKPGKEKTLCRRDLFSTTGYDLDKLLKSSKQVSKIPYSWDFGFLMLDRETWELPANSSPYNHSGSEAVNQSRRAISHLKHLSCPASDRNQESTDGQISWKKFTELAVELCKKRNGQSVAPPRNRKSVSPKASGIAKCYIPFALAPEIQESLACIFLEIWVSQIELNLTVEDAFKYSRHDVESIDSLGDSFRKFKKQAVQALLLLSALLPPERVSDENELIANEVLAKQGLVPIAIRSWYSASAWIDAEFLSPGAVSEPDKPTASDDTSDVPVQVYRSFVPAQLPGTRIVRGDWFLSIARGSRSYQMGERAIDILCSRRANIVRLQKGIGLPVRDSHEDGARELWTALWYHAESTQKGTAAQTTYIRESRVKYEELLTLAPVSNANQPSAINWLWRSRIGQYDRHSRLFRRWICAMLKRMPLMLGSAYNADDHSRTMLNILDETEGTTIKEISGLTEVSASVDQLIESLRRATVATIPSAEGQ